MRKVEDISTDFTDLSSAAILTFVVTSLGEQAETADQQYLSAIGYGAWTLTIFYIYFLNKNIKR